MQEDKAEDGSAKPSSSKTFCGYDSVDDFSKVIEET